jgi:hypothetical protein
MYSYGYVYVYVYVLLLLLLLLLLCSVLGIVFHCVVLCTVCVYLCTVLLPPGVDPIAVNKYNSNTSCSTYVYSHVLLCDPFEISTLG